MPPDDGDASRVAAALDLVAAAAREREQRLAACERLLEDERQARRADLEHVLDALGVAVPAGTLDVRRLAELAVASARAAR